MKGLRMRWLFIWCSLLCSSLCVAGKDVRLQSTDATGPGSVLLDSAHIATQMDRAKAGEVRAALDLRLGSTQRWLTPQLLATERSPLSRRITSRCKQAPRLRPRSRSRSDLPRSTGVRDIRLNSGAYSCPCCTERHACRRSRLSARRSFGPQDRRPARADSLVGPNCLVWHQLP